MSGFGVLAWIAIGSIVGWTVSRLMLDSEDDALRGTAAGMIGATLGGLGARLLDAAPPGGHELNGAVAALAGSLWLTWLTCVVTTGRQRGDGRTAMAVRLEGVRVTSTYSAARDTLVDQLLRDAMSHDAEQYDDVGRRFATVERELPRGAAPELVRLRVALTFWDAWIDARNRGWQPDSGIAKAEWPSLARSVAADLEGDRDMTNARVVTRFDAAAVFPPPGNRVQALAARLRAG